MNKRIGLVSLGLAGVLVVGGGVAVAATTGLPGSGGAINGCYTNAEVNGSHAVVLQDAGTSCPKGTTAVSWSEQGPAGPQGLQGQPGQAGQAGQPGPAGADGSSIVTSPDVPTAACNPGDIDVDLANGEVYTCVVSTGAGAGKVSTGSGTGAAVWSDTGSSIMGSQGSQGPAGTPGTNIVTSADVPTAACNPGDIDVDLANGEVYTCVAGNDTGVSSKAGGSGATSSTGWIDTGSSIMGPQGPAGTPGANGTNIVTSADVPTDACNLGDNDVDLANGEVYTCVAGTGYDPGLNKNPGGSGATSSTGWIDTGSSIMGPQGPQGPPGPGYVFTSTSGAAGPPLTDGTYFVDVKAWIGNTGPADAVIGDCAVSGQASPEQRAIVDGIAGTFAVPAVAADEDLTPVPFSFSGIMTVGTGGSAITPEFACADTTGATVTPDSVTWWVSPVATSS
jgi:hypothetical protein